MVDLAFWISAAILFYVCIGYPALLAVLAMFCRRPRSDLEYLPSVSMLIAAYNEEANIARKIQQTLDLQYPPDKLEILVVSDGSSDNTDSIVQSFTDPRVRLLRIEERRGKTHAQNRGVQQCQGEIIVFSDATTVYHPKAILYLASNYKDGAVGAVSGRYKYFDPEGDSPTGLGTIAFWNYENLIKKLQSRIRTITGCSGCIYSVRKSQYTPLPDDSCSDLVEPLHTITNGYRVVFEERALAYEQTTKSTAEEFGMRVRVVTQGIRGVMSLPELLNFRKYGWVSLQLFSHKILRWLVPYLLIILFATNAALIDHVGFRYFFLLQVAFYTFGLISIVVPLHRRWRPLSIPLYFCTLNAAAMLSVIEVFRGTKYVCWETVRK